MFIERPFEQNLPAMPIITFVFVYIILHVQACLEDHGSQKFLIRSYSYILVNKSKFLLLFCEGGGFLQHLEFARALIQTKQSLLVIMDKIPFFLKQLISI